MEIKRVDNHSDAELFDLLNGEKEMAERAFAELYARHSPRVYAYCRRFLGNKEEAEDIFQEVFVRFYQCASEKRVMTNVPGFLLRIARNLCVNIKKREKKLLSYEDYMAFYSGREDSDELINLIKMALDLLSEDLKEAFILREYDGMSYNDIADITGEPLSTVKIRIYRAKQKIREILAPYLNDVAK
ncbi:MAG: hypothetical protein QG635_592 [Bacteroidota bacterium]|nr:hypothetical protein [Bacteroidota bacterium]